MGSIKSRKKRLTFNTAACGELPPSSVISVARRPPPSLFLLLLNQWFVNRQEAQERKVS